MIFVERYFTTTEKIRRVALGPLQGQVKHHTALIYETDYYAFNYLSSRI